MLPPMKFGARTGPSLRRIENWFATHRQPIDTPTAARKWGRPAALVWAAFQRAKHAGLVKLVEVNGRLMWTGA